MKTHLSLLLFFVATLSAYTQSSGNVGPRTKSYDDPAGGIYVSTTGNDATADGSIDKPYKSINTALASAPEGSTIILRGGYYDEKNNVRISKPNMTLKSAKGEWAVLYLPFESDPSSGKQTSTIRIDPNAHYAKLQTLEITGGFYAVCLDTKWDWEQPDRSGVSNVIIEDCIIHDSRNDGIKVKPLCNNITIRYNEIYNSGREHIAKPLFTTGQENSEGIDNVNGNDMHVHNNYIHDICSNGVYAKGGAIGTVIENNIVERTYAAGILLGFDTSPQYFDTIVNPEYYENREGIVRNNLVKNTGWEGIGLYASKDAEVYNNTIVNAQEYGTATVAGIVRSPIYFGIATQDWKNPKGCPANINPNIHNNISVQPNTFNNRMVEIRFTTILLNHPYNYNIDISGLSGNPTMNNNCYFIEGKDAAFRDNRPTSLLNNGTLSQWQSHISGDAGSIEANPTLNANYMPTNINCVEMGLLYPLILNNTVGICCHTPIPEAIAYINNGVLYIQTPEQETIELSSMIGQSLLRLQKPEGEVSINILHLKNTMIIIRGSSGWVKKLFVQ